MDNETLNALRKACKGKRAVFSEEYVIDRNGTAAAIRARIPEKGAAVQASRFLREPEVRAYIDGLMEAAAEAAGINKNNLIVKSEEIYQRCMQNKPVLEFNKVTKQWEETGEYVFDSKGAARAAELQAKLVGELTEKRELSSKEGGLVINVTPLPEDGNES